ncbi:MAG: hypothetical protein Q7S61_04175 [bacterium]|nr:hypothetical protein [bacterium]
MKDQFLLRINETSVDKVSNLYGNESPKPEEMQQILEGLKGNFFEYYSELGYLQHESVAISSGIDPSVRFIGSHISVLKPYIESDRIPRPGYHIMQNCIRTKNLQGLFDHDYYPKWGSYFPSLGTIAQPGSVERVTQEAHDLLTEKLGIDQQHVIARVNASDLDLFEAAQRTFGQERLEIGTMPEKYYQHKLGMSEVRGRNLNIALRNPNGKGFSDIGNIIVIETQNKELGVELAIGASTTVKQLYDLDHVLDCHPILGFEDQYPGVRRKIEDCILISTVLYREGLRPSGTSNRGRLLRSYTRGLSYLRAMTLTDPDKLKQTIADFEMREFKVSQPEVTDEIIVDMFEFEAELRNKENLSNEEAIIKPTLISYLSRYE